MHWWLHRMIVASRVTRIQPLISATPASATTVVGHVAALVVMAHATEPRLSWWPRLLGSSPPPWAPRQNQLRGFASAALPPPSPPPPSTHQPSSSAATARPPWLCRHGSTTMRLPPRLHYPCLRRSLGLAMLHCRRRIASVALTPWLRHHGSTALALPPRLHRHGFASPCPCGPGSAALPPPLCGSASATPPSRLRRHGSASAAQCLPSSRLSPSWLRRLGCAAPPLRPRPASTIPASPRLCRHGSVTMYPPPQLCRHGPASNVQRPPSPRATAPTPSRLRLCLCLCHQAVPLRNHYPRSAYVVSPPPPRLRLRPTSTGPPGVFFSSLFPRRI